MRTAITPHIPTGNFGSAFAFVIAVVPFREIRLQLRSSPQASQLTGSPRAHRRARQYPCETGRSQTRCEGARLVVSVRCQCEVGDSGVLTGDRPRRLSVPDQKEPQPCTQGSSISLLRCRTALGRSSKANLPSSEASVPWANAIANCESPACPGRARR